MRIAVDCRMIDSSGIGNFLKNILINWTKVEGNSFLLIGEKHILESYASDNCEILDCNIPIFSLKELLFFPRKKINSCDVFFSPNYNLPLGIGIPVISTIHDVVFLDQPKIVSKIGLLIRYVYLKLAILQSVGVVTVSNFSKDRIVHYFGNANKIKVVYNGITNALSNYQSNDNRRRLFDFEYLVFVGNVKKHKGLKVLIDAFLSLKKQGFAPNLLIVGEVNNFRTKDSSLTDIIKNNDTIVFTGRVSDEELFSIIEDANALIQPSIYEGFGLPPLESLYLRTQPIISDIAVFKEVYSDSPVVFFETNNALDLEQKIAIHAVDNHKIPEVEGLLDKFDYSKTALELLQFFNSIFVQKK